MLPSTSSSVSASEKCRMMRENTVVESKSKEVQSREEGKKLGEILQHCIECIAGICKRGEYRNIYSTSKLSAVFPSTPTALKCHSAQDCQLRA